MTTSLPIIKYSIDQWVSGIHIVNKGSSSSANFGELSTLPTNYGITLSNIVITNNPPTGTQCLSLLRGTQ